MSLTTLVIMVVVGLALVIGAVRFSGLSHPARLAGQDDAARAFALDFPEELPHEIVLAGDGVQAWLVLAADRVGLVVCFGSRTLTRILTPESVIGVRRSGSTLDIHVADFTLPRLTAIFADAQTAIRIGSMLTEGGKEPPTDA